VIDGEINGAVTGRFKFGPHLIEDVLIGDGVHNERGEILDAVYEVFDRDASTAKRYNGVKIN